MPCYNSIILEKVPNIANITNVTDFEEYYDVYWQLVLNYQLIFFPDNKIIFWGFEVKLSKNEYNLLKSIIKLQSSLKSTEGYTETQIVKPINYHRINTNKPKTKSFQEFIIKRTSSIKEKIITAIFKKVLERISSDKANPFLCNNKKECSINTAKLAKDVDFKARVIQSNLNLIYFYSELMGYTKHNMLPYASFQPLEAIKSLIYFVKGQKHGMLHRKYSTDYTFGIENNRCVEKKIRADKGKKRTKKFNYAPFKTKFNINNYVNKYD